MAFDRDGLIELGKSFLRAVWFGFLALVLTFLTSIAADPNLITTVWHIGTFAVPIGAWLFTGFGFAIKALDRYIHTSKSIESRGLALPPMQKEVDPETEGR